MNSVGGAILFVIGWIMAAGLVLFVYAYLCGRYEAAGAIIFKILLSFLIWPLMATLKKTFGGEAAAFLPIFGAVAGAYLAVLWVPTLTQAFAAPFGSLIDGGGAEVEQKPFYSIAWAKRKQSQPQEAIMEIRKQLVRFPDNHEGLMFMAEILADDLKDVSGAENVIRMIAMNPKANPAQVSSAMHFLADCRLKHQQDAEGAIEALESVVRRYPGTTYATVAGQRITRIPTRLAMMENLDRTPVEIGKYEKNLGLRKLEIIRPSAEEEAESKATLYREQLEKFPMDSEARVNLAFLYAKDLNKVPEGISQLFFLTEHPMYTPRQKAQWLNSIADIHLQYGQDRKSAAKALQRIIKIYPDTAVATLASTRLAALDLRDVDMSEPPA